jgi:hypothetical protein
LTIPKNCNSVKKAKVFLITKKLKCLKLACGGVRTIYIPASSSVSLHLGAFLSWTLLMRILRKKAVIQDQLRAIKEFSSYLSNKLYA